MTKSLMIFHEPENYQEMVSTLFRKVKNDILEKMPLSRIEHIGGSSITGAVSKGDLDIFVGVKACDFENTLKKFKALGYVEKANTLRTDELCMLVTDNYNYDVAIQLVVNGSEFEMFVKFRDFMNTRPDLVEELNDLKRRCHGLSPEKYRELKSEWITDLLTNFLT